eukprot:3404621-Rhodomonas_salina.6
MMIACPSTLFSPRIPRVSWTTPLMLVSDLSTPSRPCRGHTAALSREVREWMVVSTLACVSHNAQSKCGQLGSHFFIKAKQHRWAGAERGSGRAQQVAAPSCPRQLPDRQIAACLARWPESLSPASSVVWEA